jgi:hypothetical protein
MDHHAHKQDGVSALISDHHQKRMTGVKIYLYTTTIYGRKLVHGDKLCSIFQILAGWGKPLTPVNSRAQRQTLLLGNDKLCFR